MRVLPICTTAAGSITFSRANGSPLNRRDSSTTIPLVATQFGTVFDAPVTILRGEYLTLGGLPPVNHSEFTTVLVEFTKNIPLNYTSRKKARTYWSTTIMGGVYGSSMNNLTTNSTSFQAFFDSGNYISFLPSVIVDSVNSLFSPPVTYDEASGMYIVDCSAKAPQIGLIINNTTFWHNGEDLIYQTSEGVCVFSLVSSESVSIGGLKLNIIGVPFLKNVVAVFELVNNEMRFAKLLESGDGGLGDVGAGRLVRV